MLDMYTEAITIVIEALELRWQSKVNYPVFKPENESGYSVWLVFRRSRVRAPYGAQSFSEYLQLVTTCTAKIH